MKCSSLNLVLLAGILVTAAVLLDIPEGAAQPDESGPNAEPSTPDPPVTDPERYQRSYEAEAEGDYPAALGFMREMTRTGQRTYLYQARMGWLYYCNGQYVDGIAAYGRALRLERRSVEAYLGRSLCEMAREDWAAVIDSCNRALALAPGQYTALSRLAWAQLHEEEYRDAERDYRQLMEMYPSDMEVRANLGWALYRQGELEDAGNLWREVLEYSPENANAQEGLRQLPE